MKWIMLIGDESFGLNTIKKIEHYGNIRSYDVLGICDRYCVDYGLEHIFYDDLGTTIDDYEETELIKIPF